MEDFVDKASEADIKTLLLKVTTDQAGNQIKTNFLFVEDSVLYALDGHNYKTINAYISGIEAGFRDGRDYYHAMSRGINTFQDYENYTASWFLNSTDYLEAGKAGFIDPKESINTIPFPKKIAREWFENTFLWIYFRYVVGRGCILQREHPLYQDFVQRGYLSRDFQIVRDLRPYAIDYIVSSFIKEFLSSPYQLNQNGRSGKLPGIGYPTGKEHGSFELPYALEDEYYICTIDRVFLYKGRNWTWPAGLYYYFSVASGFTIYDTFYRYCYAESRR